MEYQLLAYEIASFLKDKQIGVFMSVTKRFPEEVIREKLDYVMSLPDHKIKNNRASYFIHLMNQYAEEQKYRRRD